MENKSKEEIFRKISDSVHTKLGFGPLTDEEFDELDEDRVFTNIISPCMQEFSDQQNATLIAEHRLMKEALEEIQKAQGEYSMDRLEHAGNTIKSMVNTASETLKNITL